MNNYFENKEENTKYAKAHTLFMNDNYQESIQYSCFNSNIYRFSDRQCELLSLLNHTKFPTKFWVNRLRTVDSAEYIVNHQNTLSGESLQFNPEDKIAVLNFASYKNPGGKFLEGSSAQEESICHRSTLYNVLSSDTFKYQYEYNNHHLNKGLYENFAIYSQKILFDEKYLIDVLTCPAPNKTPCIRYKAFTLKENSDCLYNRIKFINHICNQERVDILIAGAWGCGVFKQDPYEVAEYFVKIFGWSGLKMVVFSIPDIDKAEIFSQQIRKNKGEFVSWQTPIIM